MSTRKSIASALAGNPAAFDSQGLQQPAIDPVMLMASLGAPALSGMAKSAPGMLANEAGAVFPEGMSYPIQQPNLTMEMKDILPESQKMYRMYEALSNFHAKNYDWPNVLADKWALLRNAGGN